MALKDLPDNYAPGKSGGPISGWVLRHVSTSIGALGRLARQPVSSFLTILAIAVTLALPAAMHLVVKNVQALSSGWDHALDFSVYLKSGTSETDAARLVDLIGRRADVGEVTLIPADRALEEFKSLSGFGPALDHLSENPLPHTLVVRPSPANTTESMQLLHEELANLPEVELVQIDTEWVKRFQAVLEMLERAVGIGAVLLGAAIVIVIGNTIRLDIQNRREEIEVTKLIGASNAFVRRPFLYSGLWYGLGGGLLALGLVAYGLYALREPAARLAGLYNSTFSILALSASEALAIITIGVALGLAGSWLAAARHMRQIEPR